MSLKVGNSYKIILKINNATLTYNCKILSIDDNFISFIDKFGKEYNYHKGLIISFEELKNGGDANGER